MSKRMLSPQFAVMVLQFLAFYRSGAIADATTSKASLITLTACGVGDGEVIHFAAGITCPGNQLFSLATATPNKTTITITPTITATQTFLLLSPSANTTQFGLTTPTFFTEIGLCRDDREETPCTVTLPRYPAESFATKPSTKSSNGNKAQNNPLKSVTQYLKKAFVKGEGCKDGLQF